MNNYQLSIINEINSYSTIIEKPHPRFTYCKSFPLLPPGEGCPQGQGEVFRFIIQKTKNTSVIKI